MGGTVKFRILHSPANLLDSGLAELGASHAR
jgi:hypothetical protein